MKVLAEGGYQSFHLSNTEWSWLIFAAAFLITLILLLRR